MGWRRTLQPTAWKFWLLLTLLFVSITVATIVKDAATRPTVTPEATVETVEPTRRPSEGTTVQGTRTAAEPPPPRRPPRVSVDDLQLHRRPASWSVEFPPEFRLPTKLTLNATLHNEERDRIIESVTFRVNGKLVAEIKTPISGKSYNKTGVVLRRNETAERVLPNRTRNETLVYDVYVGGSPKRNIKISDRRDTLVYGVYTKTDGEVKVTRFGKQNLVTLLLEDKMVQLVSLLLSLATGTLTMWTFTLSKLSLLTSE